MLVLTAVFLVTLLSGINSDNLQQWSLHIRLYLPFIFLPFAFSNLPKISERDYYKIVYFFVILMTLSTVQPMYSMFLNNEGLIKEIGIGKAIPSPISHIRYSLFIAFSILSASILFYKGFRVRWKGEKYLLLAIIFYLFFFIHFFSVRSGIATLYAGLAILFIIYMLKNRAYKSGIILLILMAITPFLAYKYMPSFQKKIDYVKYDYKMYKQGKGHLYSDGKRLQSYVVGWQVFKESPLIGVGIGDVNDACEIKYDLLYGKDNPSIYPHNQYLFILAGMGILGSLIYFFSVIVPWIWRKAYREPILSMVYIILLLSFLVENTLERSVSVGFFIFFILLSLKYQKDSLERT